MKKALGFYPSPDLDTVGTQVVSPASAVLLTETIARVELSQDLSAALASWRPRLAVHDPAKVLLDLALGLAIGGDCLLTREERGVWAYFTLVPDALDSLADVLSSRGPVTAAV